MKKPVQDMSLMQEEPNNIVLFYPHVSEAAKKSVLETLDSRWIGQGPKVKLFEENFGKKLVAIATAMNNNQYGQYLLKHAQGMS